MIHQLSNCVNEESFVFPTRLIIVKSRYLGAFTYFTKIDRIISIIENISSDAEALVIELLPNNIDVSVSSKASNLGKYSNVKLTASIVGQNTDTESILDNFDNTQVVAIELSKNNTVIYANTVTPLIFSYSEINPKSDSKYTGYTINMSEKVFGKPIRIPVEDDNSNTFEFVNNGLAFELSRTI